MSKNFLFLCDQVLRRNTGIVFERKWMPLADTVAM